MSNFYLKERGQQHKKSLHYILLHYRIYTVKYNLRVLIEQQYTNPHFIKKEKVNSKIKVMGEIHLLPVFTKCGLVYCCNKSFNYYVSDF